MAAKKRIRKHDLKEDRFVTTTFQLTSFVREHQNSFLTALAALVVLVIVVLVYNSSRSRTQETAMRLAGEANIAYQRANFGEAMQRYQALIDQHGGTQEASMATFFLGDIYLKMDDYQKAIESFQIYIDKNRRDELMTTSALTGIAACYEQLDQYAQAGEFYMKSVEEFPDFFAAPEALMNAGRSYSSAGEVDRAKEAYQKLIDNYPESRYHDEAKMAAAEMTGVIVKPVQ